MVKHNIGKKNKVVDVLSRILPMLIIMKMEAIKFKVDQRYV
jgi:hypothetical protein